MLFPKEIFSHLLDYWDDQVERRQKELWSSIKARHYVDADDEEEDYMVDVYVEKKEGYWINTNEMEYRGEMVFNEEKGVLEYHF